MAQTIRWMTPVLAAVLWIAPPAGGTDRSGDALDPLVKATSGRVARITLKSGVTRSVTLEGVGCPESICSRMAISSRTLGESAVRRIDFETITAVRDVTGLSAVFVMKDGTTRPASIVWDNRMLYVVDQAGRRGAIDLRAVNSIEFVRH